MTENFRQVLYNCIPPLHRNFPAKKICEKFLFFCNLRQRWNFFVLRQKKFRGPCLNCFLRAQRNFLIKFYFENFQVFSNNFENLANSFGLRSKKFGVVVKTVFYVSTGKISRKLISIRKTFVCFGFFSENERTSFGFFSKFYRRTCENSILRVRKNTSREFFFWRKTAVFDLFGTLSNLFPTCFDKIPTRLWKLHPTSS